MIRASWGLVLLAASACGPDPAGPTPNQRGATLFSPLSTALGASMASDLKAQDAAAFDAYVKQSGGQTEADLARKISTEVLFQYADALSVSSSMEAQLKAGSFEDAWNQRKIQTVLERYRTKKWTLPGVCDALRRRVQSGQWKGGLELEFAARILDAQMRMEKD